jgi:hypothetical protein
MDPLTKLTYMSIELHHHIMRPPLAKNVDMNFVWKRAERVTIGGINALVLSAEDLLLHLCFHLTIHHVYKMDLCHLYDIRKMIEHYKEEINWQVLVDRSRAWGVNRCLYLALSLTKELLGLHLPEKFLQHLQPTPPSDFDPLSLSQRLIFGQGSGLPPSLARIRGEYSRKDKAKHVLKRIFLTKGEMASLFLVSESSLKIYFYYVLRIKYLLIKYLGSVRGIFSKDKATISELKMANQANKLLDWLVSS